MSRIAVAAVSSDLPKAIVAAKRIRHLVIALGIILPFAVNEESVFVLAWCQGLGFLPDSIRRLLEAHRALVPIGERPNKRNLVSLRGNDAERNIAFVRSWRGPTHGSCSRFLKRGVDW